MRSPALEFGHWAIRRWIGEIRISKWKIKVSDQRSSEVNIPLQRPGLGNNRTCHPSPYRVPGMSQSPHMSQLFTIHHRMSIQHPRASFGQWQPVPAQNECENLQGYQTHAVLIEPIIKLNISISNTSGILWTRKWLFQLLGCLSIDFAKPQNVQEHEIRRKNGHCWESGVSRPLLALYRDQDWRHLPEIWPKNISVQHLRFTQIYKSLESPSQHLLRWLLVLHSCNFDPGVCVAVAQESRASRAHWRHRRHRFRLVLSASQSRRIRLLSGPESKSFQKSLERVRWAVAWSCVEVSHGKPAH